MDEVLPLVQRGLGAWVPVTSIDTPSELHLEVG